MGKIIILDEHTANKIAAGEVVERPASIVKELCENSIDAGATSITIEIKNGGISYIKILDNGSGIAKDDVEIAFEKHSTSKIRSAQELHSIMTMGFRGEALASIASVSKVELVTRMAGDSEGSKIVVEGGNVTPIQDAGCPVGTSIKVRELFFNTPARYKFLKKDYTEAGYIEDVVSRLALGYPGISFKFINSGKLAIQTPGNNDILACAYSIFGNTAKATVKIDYEENGIRAYGLAGKPEIARSNRSQQIFFINNRFIKNKTITTAVEEAYKTLTPVGKYPFVILNMDLDPQLVDVNVHPTKQEVRFSDESMIFRAVYHALKNALFSGVSLVPEYQNKQENKKENPFKQNIIKSNEHEQKSIPYSPGLGAKSIFATRLEPSNTKNYYNQNEYGQINKAYEKTQDIKNQELPIGSKENEKYTEELREHSQEYVAFKIVGTAFSTYIIIEIEEELYIIDQHAAHERIMYEKLKKDWDNGSQLSQMLLIPEIVELSHKESNLAEKNKELLTKIGFNIEHFGNNTVKVNSIPLVCNKTSPKEVFLNVLDGLENSNETKDSARREENLLYRLACKAAVKANWSLSQREIAELVKSMGNVENPYTCPHGRPTIIRMTRKELEKRFGRT
jgi:DNA mismatch repair protein MutL